MDGHKFPPYVIFKAKHGGHLEKNESKHLDGYTQGIVYNVQGNMWMDKIGMLDWIQHVWKPYVFQ